MQLEDDWLGYRHTAFPQRSRLRLGRRINARHMNVRNDVAHPFRIRLDIDAFLRKRPQIVRQMRLNGVASVNGQRLMYASQRVSKYGSRPGNGLFMAHIIAEEPAVVRSARMTFERG